MKSEQFLASQKAKSELGLARLHKQLEERIAVYDRDPRICGWCGNQMPYASRRKAYCDHSCAASATNRRRYGDRKPRLSFAERRAEYLRATPFEQLGETHKREVVLAEQGGVCAECHICDWRDRPITLELDHIDGNRDNWDRDNLIFLCPNCHSQTATWRGRRLKGETQHIHDVKGMSLRQILKKSGLTPKGRNYQTIKKVFAGADLPLFSTPE